MIVAATYLTIWIALALFVLGELGRAAGDRSPLWRRARTVSAAGLALALVHTALAFAVFHGWSHADAVRNTAQQTEEVFGVRVGAGVFVNYLFFAVWFLDVLFWRPASLPTAGTRVLHAFYLVIIFNAAVVFAAGWRRAAGIVIVAALMAAWRRSAPAVRR